MQKLKTSDYIEILKYYNQPIPKINKKGRKIIKRKAEKILAEKLCRCIKSVNKYNAKDESRAIGICKNSVIKQKKLKINRSSAILSGLLDFVSYSVDVCANSTFKSKILNPMPIFRSE